MWPMDFSVVMENHVTNLIPINSVSLSAGMCPAFGTAKILNELFQLFCFFFKKQEISLIMLNDKKMW